LQAALPGLVADLVARVDDDLTVVRTAVPVRQAMTSSSVVWEKSA
jgi:hypothetical protein